MLPTQGGSGSIPRSHRPQLKILPYVLSHFSHVQFFVTTWTVARQALLSMEFSGREYWSGLLCPPPGDLPNPGIEHMSLVSPTLQMNSLPLSLWRSPKILHAAAKIEDPVCY